MYPLVLLPTNGQRDDLTNMAVPQSNTAQRKRGGDLTVPIFCLFFPINLGASLECSSTAPNLEAQHELVGLPDRDFDPR